MPTFWITARADEGRLRLLLHVAYGLLHGAIARELALHAFHVRPQLPRLKGGSLSRRRQSKLKPPQAGGSAPCPTLAARASLRAEMPAAQC